MADALISSLIEQLASTALDQIKENVRLVLDVEKEVDQFTQSLKTIQAVLKDAENRRVKEAVVQDWLDKLKGVSYDMDNVLDEWNTQALKQKIQKQENEGENVLVNKKKVRFSIPSPSNCFCFGQGSRGIVVRLNIAQTIKDLNSRLTKIAEERHKYEFQSTTTSGIEEPQRPKTSSLIDVSKIFGREHEKCTLISMLLGHSTSTDAEEGGPLVIPIVGMGGMGKTTLAQLAYNAQNVKDHFKKSIWICVSDPFDEIQIAKAIIGDDGTPISNQMDALMRDVSKFVEGKRLLLVLDDVWTEDDTKWEQLKLALMSSAKGSRILVTTRKETVARMMGATTHMIHLEKLSEQNCSSLFYHIAFFDRKKDKTDLFETIGNKIVNKCNGLPLAAKTLGSLMRYKNTPEEWYDILNSEMWELEVVEEKVFRPLLLSYHDLTSKLKPCLLLCASFPKDYQFEKDKLIELWMSQNYLNSKRNKLDKRAIGREYFDDLVMRSFFQDFQMDDYEKVRSCKMHDIVHDFVQFLTRNEYFIIEASGGNQATTLPSDSVHHLTLMSTAEGPLSLPTPFQTCRKLRSLTIFNARRDTRIDGDLILQLKCLRALNLSKIGVKEVPNEIGELLHLRYIDLSENSNLKELPDAMCNLCNLETLHLEECERLEKLPKAMGKLINLKHLYLKDCRKLSGLPKGVGRLRGLRILDRFVCGGGDDKEILELGDLGSFEHLQGTTLQIRGLGNVKDGREQAQKAQLEKKKHLLELTLHFGENSGDQQWISDEEVLNALRPHPDLKSLWVGFYEGSTLVFGNWIMSLQHLTHLTLAGFSYCESLPPLGKLPYLEVLGIFNMPRVKKVGVELLGIEETQTSPATATPTAIAFPKLKQLLFQSMYNWEEWEGVGDDCQVTIIPCLSSLKIWSAPKLKQLPDFLLHNRPQLRFEGKAKDLARRGKAVSSIG